MPQDAEVQVANAWIDKADELILSDAVPIEVGARGQVAQLWSVHYHIYGLTDSIACFLGLALSSNPDYLDDPLFRTFYGVQDFQEDRALYGRATWFWRRTVVGVGETGATHKPFFSVVVPLYGLIRPRRQMFLCATVGFTEKLDFGCELYYTPVTMVAQDMDAIDRKYGKHRRS